MLHHALAIATSMVLATGAGAHAAVISGTAYALDGDTLKLDVVSIRLHGIDAPEVGQRSETSDGGHGRPAGHDERRDGNRNRIGIMPGRLTDRRRVTSCSDGSSAVVIPTIAFVAAVVLRV